MLTVSFARLEECDEKRVFIFNDGELKRKDNTVYLRLRKQKYLPIEDIKEIYFWRGIFKQKILRLYEPERSDFTFF